MERILIFTLGISIFVLANCHHQTGNMAEPESSKETMTGIVHYIDLEGGFWGIIGEDGTKYNPVNLPPEYQKEGIRVNFTAEKIENAVSIQMWGQLIRILKIKEISR